jgi:hypothetical protein
MSVNKSSIIQRPFTFGARTLADSAGLRIVLYFTEHILGPSRDG